MPNQNKVVKTKKYTLNDYQKIFVKTQDLEKVINNIKFPIMILDLEFFNHSHNIRKINVTDCDFSHGESYVYLLEFAIYRNLKSLLEFDPHKTIKRISLRRNQKDTHYSFAPKYQILIDHFIKILKKEKINTIVLAGASNDQQIINTWLKNKSEDLPEIIFWDVYPTLEQLMAFTNLNEKGEIFWEPKNLKRGFFDENTLSLPSLKKFFNYMGNELLDFKYNDDSDIYQISKQILEFFCFKKLTYKQYIQGKKALMTAENHCFNDVYKLITLLKYWINLIFKTPEVI